MASHSVFFTRAARSSVNRVMTATASPCQHHHHHQISRVALATTSAPTSVSPSSTPHALTSPQKQSVAAFSTTAHNPWSGTYFPGYCSRCQQYGHRARDCQNEEICRRCKKPGHRAFECDREKTCYRCGKVGHSAAECHEQRRCKRCGSTGHLAIECQKPKQCDICGSSDHLMGGCPQHRAKVGYVVCAKCGQEGHYARKCPN